MESVDSRQLAEWQAYELVNGRIGGHFTEDALAAIHEMLQQIARILIAQNIEHKEDIPDLTKYPRPQDALEHLWEAEDA